MNTSELTTAAELPGYVMDDASGVFVRPGSQGIGYRDGGEDALLKIIQSVSDRSTLSSELVRHMNDWPSEYHFSRKRHLVLRPFEIKRGDRVLELGSGCGSITRHLAEIGAEVTAVEGELARAAVAAKRCEGFDNVRFVADNFLALDLPEKFDWVLMIGVFEYSQKYGTSADRQREYLDIARRHLKPNGTLVIAIENKLGLKYLNGAGEDHNGKRFYGPQDLYGDNDITTWGRVELQDMLAAAGFAQTKFFAAFPDYKLPKIIFSEDIDQHRHFRAEELLHYTKSLDYRGKNERIFDESLVMASLRKNGMMVDMANSFLIACRLDELQDGFDPNVLAHYFSVDRQRHLCTHTRFMSGVNGQITVIKKPIDADQPTLAAPMFVTTESGDLLQLTQFEDKAASDYYPGRLMGFDISKALKKGDAEQLKTLLKTWAAFLVHSFQITCRHTGQRLTMADLEGRRLASVMIEGAAIDCGPQNIILGERIHAFDLEWQSDQPVPLAWVLNRNAKHAVRLRHSNKQVIQVTDIVGFIAEMLGVTAMTEDIAEANYLEKQFQSGVALVEPSNITPLTEALDLP
ncbi:MAG: hypothetical protein RL404_1723 [Pseudomonadota bacterium]|jgi:SAM-dependent methyltransferase